MAKKSYSKSKAEERKNWIASMFERGLRGKHDYFRTARKMVMPTFQNVEKWKINPSFGSRLDILHWDVPRKDVEVVKIHGRNIYVGGELRKKSVPFIKRVIENNFTANEIKKIKNLYIETDVSLPGLKGRHTGYETKGGVKFSKVTVDKKYHDDEDTLTHEVIHAHRSASNRIVKDVDRDEKETDLEALARQSNPRIKKGGYYQYAPKEIGIRNAIERDRKGLTGSMGKSLKGKKAIERTREYYPKSIISGVHFSPPELIDRYFYVILKNGTKANIHMRFDRTVPLQTIKKRLKEEHGKEIKAWEWRDGKKFRII